MFRQLKGFFGQFPIRLTATVLFAILIPSLLVTALGLVATFQADEYVTEHARHPFQQKLQVLRTLVAREWGHRMRVLTRRVEDAGDRRGRLTSLRRDPGVSDVVAQDLVRAYLVPLHEPWPELWYDGQDPGLEEARRLETIPGGAERALEAYRQILSTRHEDAALLEASLGAARCARAAGRDRAVSLGFLDRVVSLYGKTRDETGVPRLFPLLLGRLDLLEAADARTRQAAALRLATELALHRARIGPELVDSYRRELVARGFREQVEKALASSPSVSPDVIVEARHVPSLIAALSNVMQRLRYIEAPETTTIWLEGIGESTFATFPVAGATSAVHVLLDRSSFLSDVDLFLDEVQISRGSLRTVRTSGPDAGTQLPDSEATGGAIASIPLPAPFADLAWHYVPEPGSLPPGFRGFGVFTLATFAWTIIVLVLTIVAGSFLTLRSVFLEMKTARMKSDFVSFISHELKTPLTAIRMFSETLLDDRVDDDEERKVCLQTIDREAERLARLIDRVLDYSRIQKQQRGFVFTSGSMDDVIEEAVGLFHEYHKDPVREIEVNRVQRTSNIKMDRGAMVELMLNLLSNAAKYSPPDRKIVINIRESIDEITVEVVDAGAGIRKRDQRRIFEQFYRAEDYLTRDVDGYGMGLAFARYIAREHKGDIRVSSQLHSGSTFSVHLRKTDVLAE